MEGRAQETRKEEGRAERVGENSAFQRDHLRGRVGLHAELKVARG